MRLKIQIINIEKGKIREIICGNKINCKFISEHALYHKMTQLFKTHPALKIVNGALVSLPSPSNISTWWNFGSLLGVCLGVQIASGLLLAIQFTGETSLSFARVAYLSQEAFIGCFIRTMHANGASFFFFCLYFHAGRGMYYNSFKFHITWLVGVVILLVVMGTAFLGYVLPWGQISFWGASVITRLPSDVPFIGPSIVTTLWGGLSVRGPTLTRFFALHFLLPFLVAAIAIIHLLFLHQTGSNNPLGTKSDYDKIPFQPYFSFKDLSGALIILSLLWFLVVWGPWFLGDPENFTKANSLVTPIHIQPEWYFLFAYAILRSIPNKLGGVVALAIAIIILMVIVFYPNSNMRRRKFYPLRQFYFWALVGSVLLLTWIGARPVEEPYIITGQLLTVFYFAFYFLSPSIQAIWDRALS